MTKTIKLKTPLLVNGEQLKELSYDFDLLTCQDMLDTLEERSKWSKIPATGVDATVELDTVLHMILAAMAISRATPAVSIDDCRRLSLADMMTPMKEARNFFLGLSESKAT